MFKVQKSAFLFVMIYALFLSHASESYGQTPKEELWGGYVLKRYGQCDAIQLILNDNLIIYPDGERVTILEHKTYTHENEQLIEFYDEDKITHIFRINDDESVDYLGKRYHSNIHAMAPAGFTYVKCDTDKVVHRFPEKTSHAPSMLDIKILNHTLSSPHQNQEDIKKALSRIDSLSDLKVNSDGTIQNLGEPVQHPLIIAVMQQQDASVIDAILKLGSDTNIKFKNIPIAVYTYCKNPDVFKLFVKHGLDLGVQLESGITLKEKLNQHACP